MHALTRLERNRTPSICRRQTGRSDCRSRAACGSAFRCGLHASTIGSTLPQGIQSCKCCVQSGQPKAARQWRAMSRRSLLSSLLVAIVVVAAAAASSAATAAADDGTVVVVGHQQQQQGPLLVVPLPHRIAQDAGNSTGDEPSPPPSPPQCKLLVRSTHDVSFRWVALQIHQ